MYSVKTIFFWILVLYIRGYRWFEYWFLRCLKSPIHKYINYRAVKCGIIISDGEGQLLKEDEDDSRFVYVQIHNDNTFIRITNQGTIGLVETYMEGWWDCDNLEEMSIRIGETLEGIRPHPLLLLMDWITLNSDERPWENEMKEWTNQIGADFFRAMLGEFKLYSCGYWNSATTLEQAHLDNMSLLGRKLALTPGMRVLDMGCGYGALSRFLADKFNVELVGITNSTEEAAEARQYSINNSVKILECDYKDVSEKYDRIVCVQMLEHLGGPRHYKKFFDKMYNNLTPDGLFVLQSNIISTLSNALRCDPFSRKYLLQNSVAPHHLEILKAIEKKFLIEDIHNIGGNMEKTLLAYLANLEKEWQINLSKKYDVKYYRMFTLCLRVYIAAVKTRRVQMFQFVFSKKNSFNSYESVR